MPMNRLTWHHSGGGYKPSETDLLHYHFVIDGDGEVHHGNHTVDENSSGLRLIEGHYAAHTWKLNSGNIGAAVAAMAGGQWADPYGCKAPVRNVQIDSLITLSAALVVTYDVAVDREHTLSHAEVQPTLGVTQRNKWDFDYDPRRKLSTRDPVLIGDELRQELLIKLKQIVPKHADLAKQRPPRVEKKLPPTIKQGSEGPDVELLQRILGVKPDGIFGPQTRTALVHFQKKRQLLPDGIAGPMTWSTLLIGSKYQ